MPSLNIYRLNNITRDFQKRGTVDALVVVAEDEACARRLACSAVKGYSNGHGEAPTPEYMDPTQTYCEQIGIALPTQAVGVVVVDYDKDYNDVDYDWEVK